MILAVDVVVKARDPPKLLIACSRRSSALEGAQVELVSPIEGRSMHGPTRRVRPPDNLTFVVLPTLTEIAKERTHISIVPLSLA